MTNTFSFAQHHLPLARYPQVTSDTLQAWNAADELLIAHVQSEFEQRSPSSALILNDEFGALSCALNKLSPDCHIFSVTDSEVAIRASHENLVRNALSLEQVTLQPSLSELHASDTVLMRLPKNLAYFEYQLIELQKVLKSEQIVCVGAMLKNLPKTAFSLLEKYIGPVTTSLAKKKARLLFARFTQAPSPQPYPLNWALREHQWQLRDHANVFCLGKFDIGTRFLLDHFPQHAPEHVIDLGCGNGLLGLKALELYPHARVDFIDESHMALASAQNNVAHNAPQALIRAHFMADNCLEQQPSQSADLILCNPPFHQQNTVSTHIAEQMFKDAKRCLRIGGQLLIVANRHLAYAPLLKRLFGGFKIVASNNKFVIISAYSRRV